MKERFYDRKNYFLSILNAIKQGLNWLCFTIGFMLISVNSVSTYASTVPTSHLKNQDDVSVVIHKGHTYDPTKEDKTSQKNQQYKVETDPDLRWPKEQANLVDILRFALANHPTALRADTQINQAEDRLRASQGGLLPTLTARAAYGPERSDNSVTRSLGKNEIDLIHQEKSLQIQQLIYDGGKIWNRVERDQAALVSRQEAAAGVKENVTLRVVNAYLTVLRFRASLDIAIQDVAVHRLHLKKIRLRVEGGAGRQSELNLAKTRLDEALARYDLAERDLESANNLFIQEVGRAPPPVLAKASISARELPEHLSGARTTAFKNNPAIASSEADINASGHDIAALKAEYLPTVSLDLESVRDTDLNGIRGQNNQDFALLQVNYNLYNGGSDRARVKEAIAKREEAEQQLAFSRRDVDQRISTAWTDMVTTKSRYDILKSNVKNAALVVKNYKKEFEIGQRSLLDLLDAENEHFNAENNLIEANFEYGLSQYRILEAMGVLSSTVLAG